MASLSGFTTPSKRNLREGASSSYRDLNLKSLSQKPVRVMPISTRYDHAKKFSLSALSPDDSVSFHNRSQSTKHFSFAEQGQAADDKGNLSSTLKHKIEHDNVHDTHHGIRTELDRLEMMSNLAKSFALNSSKEKMISQFGADSNKFLLLI